MKDIERLKEEGNVLFKQGSLEPAIEKYTEALEVRTTNALRATRLNPHFSASGPLMMSAKEDISVLLSFPTEQQLY